MTRLDSIVAEAKELANAQPGGELTKEQAGRITARLERLFSDECRGWYFSIPPSRRAAQGRQRIFLAVYDPETDDDAPTTDRRMTIANHPIGTDAGALTVAREAHQELAVAIDTALTPRQARVLTRRYWWRQNCAEIGRDMFPMFTRQGALDALRAAEKKLRRDRCRRDVLACAPVRWGEDGKAHCYCSDRPLAKPLVISALESTNSCGGYWDYAQPIPRPQPTFKTDPAPPEAPPTGCNWPITAIGRSSPKRCRSGRVSAKEFLRMVRQGEARPITREYLRLRRVALAPGPHWDIGGAMVTAARLSRTATDKWARTEYQRKKRGLWQHSETIRGERVYVELPPLYDFNDLENERFLAMVRRAENARRLVG